MSVSVPLCVTKYYSVPLFFYCVPPLCVSMWWNLRAGDLQSLNDWNDLTLLINIWLMAQSEGQWHNLTYCDTVWNIVTQCDTLLTHWGTQLHCKVKITHFPPLSNLFCINTVFSYNIFSISIVTWVTSGIIWTQRWLNRDGTKACCCIGHNSTT